MRREPIVSARDKERIIDRILTARSRWTTYAPYLDWFRTGLIAAKALPPSDLPSDVITMNSRFGVIDLWSGAANVYTLVYPEDEAFDDGRLCVLSPMGMALLGAAAGDVVRWTGARRVCAAEVGRVVYQPEAAGHPHL